MGKIAIDKERCKGCQLCVVTCPKKIIRLSEEFNEKGYHFVVFDDSDAVHGLHPLRADLPGHGH